MTTEIGRLKLALVVPVRNEATVLEASVGSMVTVLQSLPIASWQLVIASNNSTDDTNVIGEQLSRERAGVVLRTSLSPGKGRAIREAWQSIEADVYAFTDVDLSVDLSEALPHMIQAIETGSDLAVGSRALPDSRTDRPLSRRLISRGYKFVARLLTGTKLTDLPCGCKMVSARVVDELVPQVEDNAWFFDSELLLRAERASYVITEVPVRWVEQRYRQRQRSIPIVRVSAQYLRALLQVRRSR